LWWIGLVLASYGISQLIVRIPLGIWVDRHGRRRRWALASILVSGVSAAGLAVFAVPWAALIFRALAGLSAAGWVLLSVWFGERFRPGEIPRAMGLANLATRLGQIGATLVGGYLAQWRGWTAPFWVAALVSVGSWIIWARLPSAESVGGNFSSGRIAWSSPSMRRVYGSAGLAAVAYFIQYTTVFGFTMLKASRLGADASVLGWLNVSTGLLGALAGYATGAFGMAKWGIRRLLVGGFTIAGLATAGLARSLHLLPLFLYQWTDGVAIGAITTATMARVLQNADPVRKTTMMGVYQALYAIGMVAGPLVAGSVAEVDGIAAAFWIAAGLGVMTAVAVIAVPRTWY